MTCKANSRCPLRSGHSTTKEMISAAGVILCSQGAGVALSAGDIPSPV